MNLSNYYWYFESALSPKFCDEVIKYANSKKEVLGRTGGYEKEDLTKEEIKNLQRKRKSDLVWLDDPWIYKEIQPYVHRANVNANESSTASAKTFAGKALPEAANSSKLLNCPLPGLSTITPARRILLSIESVNIARLKNKS